MKKAPLPDDMLTPPMLIGQISRMQRCTLRSRENDPIMTQNSCRSLLFCLSHEEGITQLELSRRAGLKPPTVSVALKHLEDEGYIVREVDADDKRAARVYLSDKGHALERENTERFNRVDDEMMRGFSEEEIAQLRKMLLRIRDNLGSPKGKCEK
ncbi:MAG: MarR family transcriptional regulator [Clostridia bacterium]|nr:MarR family transcriptional regulator [Clostridia bacterium]